jgi:hypothetical protein
VRALTGLVEELVNDNNKRLRADAALSLAASMM